MEQAEQTEGPPPDALRAAGDRIEALIDASGSGGVVARERAEELVRLVADLYGAGLERILDIMYDRGHLDDDVLAALAADELVSSLLLVHGLHPHDAATRVGLAIRGTGVELIEITPEGVCRLRGRRPHGLDQLIEAAAPEITAISVEAPKPLIPVSALFTRPASGMDSA